MKNVQPNHFDTSSAQRSITGTIVPNEGMDGIGIIVQAFARAMPSVERRVSSAPLLLGEAIADREGHFQIDYAFEQPGSGEVSLPSRRISSANTNVSFRVFNGLGQELTIKCVKALDREYCGDQIIFSVPAQLHGSIEIDAPSASAAVSEYEQLIAVLSPVIGVVPLAELSDEDVAFIYGQLQIEAGSLVPQRIAWLRRCAWLERETHLPTEAFYGWGRKNVPVELAEMVSIAKDHVATISEKLTDLPETALRSGLLAAIDENIVPAGFGGRVSEIVRLMKRRGQVRRSVTAQLRDETNELPLAAYTVTVFDKAAGNENRGMYITDRAGRFSFDFYHSPYMSAGHPQSEFRLEVRSPSGDALPDGRSLTVSLNRPPTEVVHASIKVPDPDAESRQHHFRRLMTDPAMMALKHLAEKQGIRTFADIRRQGGLRSIGGLPKMDPAVVRELEALADLDRISPDVAVSHSMLKKGFKSVLAVALTPQPEFVAAMTGPGAPLSGLEAAKLHVAATAQTRILDNMLVERAVNSANGFRLDAGDPANPDEGSSDTPCNCPDCEAAVSPAAYLAALLDFALTNIRQNGTDNIDLKFLADTFHQPFSDLPTDCGAVDEQLVQARICVEALRSFLGNRPLSDAAKETALAKAEADVYFSIYSLLLTRIGTSYEEIRRARTDTLENRQALAERLGISLTEPSSTDGRDDELDQLFLDPAAKPTEAHSVTALALEDLFGFVDTSRDPLSKGTKWNDDENHLKRWNLQGVQWNENTDSDGAIYVTLETPVSDVFQADLYRDAQRTQLVASGTLDILTSSTIKLVSKNNSGLTGVFEIGGLDDVKINITVIPRLVSWNYRNLRTLWGHEDYPTDIYDDPSSSSDNPPPIIDPDLIGPDDFRHPAPKPKDDDPDRAFDFWLKRRAMVDDILSTLQAAREASSLTELLQQELGDSKKLEALLLTLTNGGTRDEMSSATGALKDLHLSVESFIRLMALRAKELAASDPPNEHLSTGEWSEVYSILTQARKSKMFETWRAEEKDAKIILGFEEFWFSLSEPQVGEWPVVAVAGQPLIDPDLVKLTDLPEWLAGKEAIDLWMQRKSALDQIPLDLKQKFDSDGFDEMLKLALGDPDPGDPLPDDLNALSNDLNSPSIDVRNAAIGEITTDLHLTVDSFSRLIVVKAASDQTDPAKKPTAAQLAEVYALLTPASKIKHEYQQWIEEEEKAGLLIWQALKAKLPLWRASVDNRQAWQQVLRNRTGQPIIDPLLIGPDDLKNVIPGDPAFDLWKSRFDHIASLHDGLKATHEALKDNAVSAFGAIIQSSLGFDLADLETLEKDQEAGHTIDKRLDQLNLENASFAYLMRIDGLATAGQPILDSEWEIVYNTLVQAEWKRETAAFRLEEQAAKILLGPDSLVVATELSTPLPFLDQFTPPWLSVRQARSDWQDTLQSRIDQQAAVQQALDTAVGVVEQLTLPVLRGALIEASFAIGDTAEERAEWITARLLIDARVDGCQITTRVAQAIETIQTLIFGLRTGQLKQPREWLVVDAPPIRAGSAPSGSSVTESGSHNGVLAVVGEDNKIHMRSTSDGSWFEVAPDSNFTIPAQASPVLFCFERIVDGGVLTETSLFAVGNDHHINATQTVVFGFKSWDPIGSIQVRSDARIAAGAILKDSILHAFVVSDDGQVFGNWQDTTWHDWTAVGNSDFRVDTKATITAASTALGVYLFAAGNDGTIHKTQVVRDTSSDWALVDAEGDVTFLPGASLAAFGGSVTGQIFVILYAVGQDGGIYSTEFREASGKWSAWSRAGALSVSPDSTITGAGSSLRQVTVGSDGRVYEWEGPAWEAVGDTTSSVSLPVAVVDNNGAVQLYRAKGTQVLTTSRATAETSWILQFPLSLGGPQFDQEKFDEEWQWLGSYSTFRAATFVFLYPENILQPSLLRDQTPAFKQLVANTRGQRLDAQTACQYAEDYASYFRDICSLEIEATCQASTIAYTGDGCDRQPFTVPSMFYMFGRAPSGKIYWSAWSASLMFGQGMWAKIEGFDDTTVVQIIGAMPYRKTVIEGATPANVTRPFAVSSYLHLFCIVETSGNKSLRLARLNLDDFGIWAAPIELTPPIPFNPALEIIPVQTQSDVVKPGLVFHTKNHAEFYYRTLDENGTAWEPSNTDWGAFLFSFSNFEVLGVRAVLSVNGVLWFVLGQIALMVSFHGGQQVVAIDGQVAIPGDGVVGVIPGSEASEFSATLDSNIYIFVKVQASDRPTEYWHVDHHILSGQTTISTGQVTFADISVIAPSSGGSPFDGNGESIKVIAWKEDADGKSYMYRYAESGDLLVESARIQALPRIDAPLNVPIHLAAADLQVRRQQIITAFTLNADAPTAVMVYLREAYYFAPMHIALALQTSGEYLAALDCFRTVYDYEAPLGPPTQRNIYFGLELDSRLPDVNSYQEPDGWWADPLDPHSIAETRRFAYTRFTVMSVLRCMLDFADSEFTQDTSESLATARTLYLTALGLLNLPELQQNLNVCEELISHLEIGVGNGIPPEVPAAVGRMIKSLRTMPRRIGNLADIARQLAGIFKQRELWKARLSNARSLLSASVDNAVVSSTLGAALKARLSGPVQGAYARLRGKPQLDDRLQLVSRAVVSKVFDGAGLGDVAQQDSRAIPLRARMSLVPGFTPILSFCIPPNPILYALRLRAELNLFKLRTCRNIAGLRRELNAYAAPTDTKTGVPSIGSGGQLVLPGTVTVLPSLYRYSALIERAKQLVQLAAQMEAAMLAAIEKEDAEKQALLQAKQQLSLAQAGVQLQELRVNEANDGIALATLQQQRAQIQKDTYTAWIDAGLNEYENQMIQAYQGAAAAQKAATEVSRQIQIKQSIISSEQLAEHFGTLTDSDLLGANIGVINFGIDATLFNQQSDYTKGAIDATANAQIASINAALERRKDEWQLQKQLAEQDSQIAEQQQTIATDQVQVVKQERVIAGIQSDNAKAMVDFLSNKFTNAELFDWMSNILQGVYRFFLQQATGMAKLAETQLAFERQEVPPATIMSDYWEGPSDGNTAPAVGATGPDRRGLTGSARLLQDIFQLDQYAFATNKRKLSIVKTFSMARLVPAEFQRFRETGVLPFATPMEMFDRGFPGHYLRLIKRVQVNVVALVPALQGIYATLSTTGPSRVVVGGDTFQTVPIQRPPEFLAISSASAISGAAASDTQSDLLLPFEGSGVDMSWEFNMPKAANLFDYRTIADVILTIEYTALYSPDYRQQVIQSFKPKLTADCALSFRNQFSDQWYDLHNPDQTDTPMTVSFTTSDTDFPPNVDALRIQQLLLYFVRTNGASFEVPVTYLHYTAEREAGTVGGAATSIDGVISTRRGNAGSWTAMIGKSPIGEWELALPKTEEIRNRFKNDEIDDILIVITYSGRTPDWPS